MAWYYGTFKCGHEGRVNVIGPVKDRERKVEYLFSRVCEDCYKKQIQEKREKDNQQAAEESKEMDLPELEGTPKQVAWANTIRCNIIKKFSSCYDEANFALLQERNPDKPENYYKDMYFYVINKLQLNTSASFWIDNRNASVGELKKEYVKEFVENYSSLKSEEIPEEVKEETTISKEDNNGIIVEVSCINNTMHAKCNKNDNAISIFKSLNMRWSNGSWNRKLNEFTGEYIDRGSELVNKLLNSGFIVNCQDKSVRELAASGKYKEEVSNWVTAYDKDEGYVCVRMFEQNDTLYHAVREIYGTMWDSETKCIKVPIENYEELLDIAYDFGIGISKKSEEKINKYKRKIYNSKKIEVCNNNQCESNLDLILNSSDEILGDLIDN